jgi:hypothetical protein
MDADPTKVEVGDLDNHDLSSIAVYLDKREDEVNEIFASVAEPDYKGNNELKFYPQAEVNGYNIPMPYQIIATGAGEIYDSINVDTELIENMDKKGKNIATLGNPHSGEEESNEQEWDPAFQ